MTDQPMATSDEGRGLYYKYDVHRVDGKDSNPESKHYGGCQLFVLDVDHDPYAKPALAAYAEACRAEFPFLARDLDALYAPTPVEEAWSILTQFSDNELDELVTGDRIRQWLADNKPASPPAATSTNV